MDVSNESPPCLASDPLLISLPGVGPERSAQLARLGLRTLGDLLLHRPRRYEDRRHVLPIVGLELNQATALRGRIVAMGLKRYARGRKSVFEIILDDGTARLHCRWWNLPYMQGYFQPGDEVLVFGKPLCLKPRTMDHPETEVIDSEVEASIHLNRIAPVYPLTEGLPQRWLRALIWRCLEDFGPRLIEPWPRVCEPQFQNRRQAIQALHFPIEPADAVAARRRLALDELIELQLALQRRRQTLLSKAQGRPCRGDNRLIKPFLRHLGFQLTGAQTRVLRQLRSDMAAGSPMRRLLQGDVGSGKTVVAACCALFCIESGFDVAFMAPTEILAEQHYGTFGRWFERLGLTVHLQTGSRKTSSSPQPGARSAERGERSTAAKERNAVEEVKPTVPAAGGIVIGTHALIEDAFAPKNLGLVIIDEQHRFGVSQREQLVRKGDYPHLLVMTATPIPRSLGLTLYGDLDISVIDELPAGRVSIKTFVRSGDSLPKVWDFVRAKLTEGRQAFVVFPRIEDTGKGLKAVKQEYASLQERLAPSQVGLLHGGLSAEQKEATMSAFRANKLHVLLSTSLIEVGIDVPNATVMLIEDADQFGLAQLHQLRGRIGRGSHEAYCVLISHAKTPDAEQRLEVLASTTDGFRIAEEDLKLRGAGDLLGQDQSGVPPFKFANLAEDVDLVEQARVIAAELLRAR